MSFFKCCVGAEKRPSADEERPAPSSHQRRSEARSNLASEGASKRKFKLPTEVFFDPSKPDGQLSSITDPANSMRDVSDIKKRRETNERTSSTRDGRKLSVKVSMPEDRTDMDAQDNNGLTRGQNFMKVEKWLRNSAKYKQIDITPREIKNIEDCPAELPDSIADPPSEKDRLPPAMLLQRSSAAAAAAAAVQSTSR